MASVNENVTIKIREDGSRVVSRNLKEMGEAAEDAEAGILNLKTVLLGLVGGATLGALAQMADQFTNIQNRLRLVTTGSENLARVTSELGKIANDTRSDFSATAELYSRMATSSKELGLSQQQLLGFTKSLNQAVILSGASAEEAAGGIRQLSQGMASGTLRGDELNSVLENLPAVADVIAKSLGITRGELRQMGQDGKLTAGQIVEAFEKAKDELEKGFATTVPTLGQAFTVLKNNVMLWVGEMDKSYGITSGLAALMLELSKNLDTIIPILAGVAVAIATAFAPAVIIAFMGQIRALWALMLANPFVAVAAVVTGLITTLYLMRDEIKLGIDDTTTLGDLMRAAWESIGPIIQSVADIASQFFGWLTNTSGGTFDALIDDINGYEHANESTWLKILRTVVKVFDMIGGVIRGTMAGIQAVVMKVIAAIMNNFAQLGKAFTAATEFDGEALLAAVKSNIAGYKEAGTDIGGTFGAAFAKEQLRQSESGLESMLDGVIDRAKEIGAARKAAEGTGGDFAPGGTPTFKPPVDADAAKKAAKELERLKNALANVMDQADPVGAATRRLAEAQDILTRSVKAGLITQAESVAVYEELAYQMRDQLDPLGALNRAIDENIDLLKLSSRERDIEGQMLQYTQQLRQQGIKLTTDETNALRAKLIVEQQLADIAAARDDLEGGSSAERMREFMTQIEAVKQLLADTESGFGGADVAGALGQLLPWANLEQTQEQMAAYVQAHADMYAQIKALEDAQIINTQTAAMLRNQADYQALEQRLSYTRQFFGSLAQLSTSENKKLAQIGKAAAIVQATIDGVLAVQKTMAETPYPYNIPLAAVQAGLAAANVAKIASTGFRTGGEFTVGGSGGSDSQMVAFRATPGEKVRVNTPTQDRAIREGEGKGGDVNVPVTIVNVDDPQRYVDAMDTAAGKGVIMNMMQSDPAGFKRTLGIS